MSKSFSFLDPGQLNLKRATRTETSTTETWTFTNAQGATLLVVVVTYIDSTKAKIDHIDRTVPAAI